MDGISEDELEKYILAGKIAKKALEFGINLVRTSRNISLLELAKKIEETIVKLGGFPAFPCNLGVNDVAAHYTPLNGEVEYIPNSGLLKIDVGVHIDGYIADTAATVPLSDEYSEIIEVNKEILDKVLDIFSVGVKVGEIGRIVENLAKKYGYIPISNLTGHSISRYTIHAGKYIPNVYQLFSPKISDNEVYAIEPFITFRDGSGVVKERKNEIRIFSLIKIKKEKDRELEAIRRLILTKYKKLPFTSRWLVGQLGKEAHSKILKLYRRGVVRGYPVLVESKGSPVSQFEHTVVVYNGEVIVTTK